MSGYTNEYSLTDTDIEELDPQTRREMAQSIGREHDILARALDILERNEERGVADRVRDVIRRMDQGSLRLFCTHGNGHWYADDEFDCDDCGRSLTPVQLHEARVQ